MTAAKRMIEDVPVVARVRDAGFGTTGRPRRKPMPVSSKSNAELVAEYLKNNAIKKCETRYADGAVEPSGSYAW